MKTSLAQPHPFPKSESPLRHLPFVDLLVDTKTELLELALRSGLKVFTAMLEEDSTASADVGMRGSGIDPLAARARRGAR